MAWKRLGGEALAFLDADDAWLPDKLEQQVGLLRAHPEADMVWGRTRYWFGWTGNPDDKQLDNVAAFPEGLGGLVRGAALRAVCFQGAPPSNCASLFRTEFVRRIGGWESSFKGLFEDQVFWAKACTLGAAYIDDQCVARYRMHPDSSCYVALREGAYHDSRKRYLEWVEAYWRDLEIDPGANAGDDPAARLLGRELRRYRRPWRFGARGSDGEGRRCDAPLRQAVGADDEAGPARPVAERPRGSPGNDQRGSQPHPGERLSRVSPPPRTHHAQLARQSAIGAAARLDRRRVGGCKRAGREQECSSVGGGRNGVLCARCFRRIGFIRGSDG